jgi:hypothetical protein
MKIGQKKCPFLEKPRIRPENTFKIFPCDWNAHNAKKIILKVAA